MQRVKIKPIVESSVEPNNTNVIWKDGDKYKKNEDCKWTVVNGGSGNQLTGLLALKDFIDKTSSAFWQNKDDAIVGVRATVDVYNIDGNYGYALTKRPTTTLLTGIAAFNENTGLFEPLVEITTSANITSARPLLFYPYQITSVKDGPNSQDTRIILFNADNRWLWLSQDFSNAYDFLKETFGESAIIYYRDLK